MRVGALAQAASGLAASMAALPACGERCTAEDKAELVAGAVGISNMFYNVFATSLDEAYYAPTKAIYLTIAQHGDAARKAEAEKFTAQLDQFKTNSKPKTGKHDAAVVAPLLAMREQVVVACYEQGLAGTPTLAGQVKLALEVAADGRITGASTTPAAGAQGLAAVGGCVEAAARTWTLPARTMPGVTRLSIAYDLSPKQ
ncbi:MAG: hypothetical protein R2939_18615 [Kofleriaceae bacterium]